MIYNFFLHWNLRFSFHSVRTARSRLSFSSEVLQIGVVQLPRENVRAGQITCLKNQSFQGSKLLLEVNGD